MKWLKRNWLRIVLLAASVAAAVLSGGDLSARNWNWVLPKLSPLLSLFGALALREWVGWSVLLGVPLLLLAFLKGRVFCWKMCPMGFLAELAGKLNPWGKGNVRRVPALNKALALVIVVTAACGYPLMIWLDPLCIFNGFFAVWREPLTWASGATGLMFVLVLLIGVIAPNAWCHKLCPLGGAQQAMMDLGRRLTGVRRKDDSADPQVFTAGQVARRTLLASVPAAVAGITARRVFGPNGANALRPPGADVAKINALCARCGNCMKACPEGLLHPDFGETGIDGLFTPVMRLRSRDANQEQFCFQDCNACTQVCPTGALRPLSLEAKHKWRVGIAVIDRTKCLAWAKNEYCVVCDEYCPYKAVICEKKGDVSYPRIDPDKCRGCGACESACAAEPLAIVVKPLAGSK